MFVAKHRFFIPRKPKTEGYKPSDEGDIDNTSEASSRRNKLFFSERRKPRTLSPRKFIFLLSLLTGIAIGLFSKGVYGAECTPVYGGGEVCPKVAIAFIDKTVLNPTTQIYVDNLTESDPRFAPQDIVVFRLTIKNTGQVTINEVTVKDIFPQYVSFHSGIGKHKDGTVTIDVGDLGPGESREFFLRGAVAKQEELPGDKTLICVVNRAEMRGKVEDEISVSDASQLCIEKKVLGKGAPLPEAKEIPATGAGSIILLTSSLVTVGVALRRYA